jgi:hypothetical protein
MAKESMLIPRRTAYTAAHFSYHFVTTVWPRKEAGPLRTKALASGRNRIHNKRHKEDAPSAWHPWAKGADHAVRTGHLANAKAQETKIDSCQTKPSTSVEIEAAERSSCQAKPRPALEQPHG